MKNFSKIILIVPLFFACQSATQDSEIRIDTTSAKVTPKNDSVVSPMESTGKYCFRYTSGKDVYTINYTKDANNNVWGVAVYDNFEKDDSRGKIQGSFDPQTHLLHVWYSFEAEGMHSVGEKYFKLEGDHLIPGLGETYEKADSSLIKDSGQLNFDKKMAYQQVDCVKQENK